MKLLKVPGLDGTPEVSKNWGEWTACQEMQTSKDHYCGVYGPPCKSEANAAKAWNRMVSRIIRESRK